MSAETAILVYPIDESPVGEMDAHEAERFTHEIHEHLASANRELMDARRKAHEVDIRRGWLAMGYSSYGDWAESNLPGGRSQAYRLRDAATIETIVNKDGSVGLIHERAIRGLVPFKDQPDVVKALYAIICDISPDGQIKSTYTDAVIDALKDALTTGTLTDGDGEQIPLTQTDAKGKINPAKIAFTDDVYARIAERVQQNKQAIKGVIVRAGGTARHYVIEKVLTVTRVNDEKRLVTLRSEDKSIVVSMYWPKNQTVKIGDEISVKVLAADEKGIDLGA